MIIKWIKNKNKISLFVPCCFFIIKKGLNWYRKITKVRLTYWLHLLREFPINQIKKEIIKYKILINHITRKVHKSKQEKKKRSTKNSWGKDTIILRWVPPKLLNGVESVDHPKGGSPSGALFGFGLIVEPKRPTLLQLVWTRLLLSLSRRRNSSFWCNIPLDSGSNLCHHCCASFLLHWVFWLLNGSCETCWALSFRSCVISKG